MVKKIAFKEFINEPIKEPSTIDKIMPYFIYGCFIAAIIQMIIN